MSSVGFADQIINPWCNVPIGGWRWIEDGKSPAKLRAIPKTTLKDGERLSLAKVYACMQTGLNKVTQADLMQQGTQDALIKLREVVEHKYASYCETYCIFARALEIFLSIFPGRQSTWMEHRRLLRTIDQCLGKIARPNEAGEPSFDRHAISVVDPILRELGKLRNDIPQQTPCRLFAEIVIKHNNTKTYLQNPANVNDPRCFDQIFNGSDDPKKFIDTLEAAVKRFPSEVTGFPAAGNVKIEIELLCIAKSKTNPQECDISFVQEKFPVDLSNGTSAPHEVNRQGESYQGYPCNELGQFKPAWDHIKLPINIVDAQGNFIT